MPYATEWIYIKLSFVLQNTTTYACSTTLEGSRNKVTDLKGGNYSVGVCFVWLVLWSRLSVLYCHLMQEHL